MLDAKLDTYIAVLPLSGEDGCLYLGNRSSLLFVYLKIIHKED